MTKKMTVIPRGSLLYMSTGAYSDYGVTGVFTALKDIDGDALLQQWLELYPVQKEKYNFNPESFTSWVISQEFIEQIHHYEWHLGDYGCSDDMEVSSN